MTASAILHPRAASYSDHASTSVGISGAHVNWEPLTVISQHSERAGSVQAGSTKKSYVRMQGHLPAAMLIGVASLAASGHARAESLNDAVTKGTVSADLRLRYENVDQDNALKEADALTVRTRLGYATQSWHQLSAFVELESTSALIDDYAPVQTGYSVVADPDDSELNQWMLSYSGLPGTKLSVGRSRLVLDNARWVGNVGWRQNEQTFDGAFLKYAPASALNLSYAYLSNVNTITFTNVDLEGHLINAKWAVIPALSITAYAYLLDYELAASADFDTYGVRADGSTALSSGVKLLYTAEYAAQKAETLVDEFDTDYLMAELGVGFKPVTIKLGYEKLGSDGGAFALQTPLATKHAFNGWADVFLATPNAGLEDVYLSLGGSLGSAKLLAMYHQYGADESSPGLDDYGSEVDVSVTMPVAGKLMGMIKYASYNADDFGVDTDKIWAQLEFKF